MEDTLHTHEAILIIGPTGSGKTPLGELLDERGLSGRPCAHFDFGRELRRIAAGPGHPEPVEGRIVPGPGRPEPVERRAATAASLFDPDEIAFIREVLDEGRLLEDEHFHVAWKILTAFIAERHTGHGDLTVLNGLPRHIGQAGDVDCMVEIAAVVHLNCTPEVVEHRIQTNAGGDRTHRTDDTLAAVRRKLALFEERTRPLVEHYAELGANIIEIGITPDTSPADVLAALERQQDK